MSEKKWGQNVFYPIIVLLGVILGQIVFGYFASPYAPNFFISYAAFLLVTSASLIQLAFLFCVFLIFAPLETHAVFYPLDFLMSVIATYAVVRIYFEKGSYYGTAIASGLLTVGTYSLYYIAVRIIIGEVWPLYTLRIIGAETIFNIALAVVM